MKIFTLIILTTCLLGTSIQSSAQTTNLVTTASSIKFNPIGIANGVVKVKMFNQPKGTYTVQVIDDNGKILGSREIQHADGTNTEIADFGKKFTGGSYKIEVIDPSNNKTHETILLLM